MNLRSRLSFQLLPYSPQHEDQTIFRSDTLGTIQRRLAARTGYILFIGCLPGKSGKLPERRGFHPWRQWPRDAEPRIPRLSFARKHTAPSTIYYHSNQCNQHLTGGGLIPYQDQLNKTTLKDSAIVQGSTPRWPQGHQGCEKDAPAAPAGCIGVRGLCPKSPRNFLQDLHSCSQTQSFG